MLARYAKTFKELTRALEENEIEFEVTELFNGFKISFPQISRNRDSGYPNVVLPDVVLHEYSYGEACGLLESMGFEEDDGDVTGYLTVEDVIERVKNAKKEEEK